MGVCQIDPYAVAVHGITKDMVRNAPRFSDIADQVYSHLKGKHVVAHNVSFDLARLNYEFGRCDYPDNGILETHCTMYMSKVEPSERRKSLSRAMEWLGIQYEGEAHRAVYDAECCRLILHKLASLGL